MKVKKHPERTYRLKNMTSTCCIRLLQKELAIEGIEIREIRLGRVVLTADPKKVSWSRVEEILVSNGFEIIREKEKVLVEEIRQAVVDLVYNSTYNAMVRNSDYLVERFGMSYPYLSTLFSKHQHITLEKFIILNKIEKVKELIESGELTLSEIAYMMGYSSVQYLSTQFKSVTGVSVTEYRENPSESRQGLDNLINFDPENETNH